jgi:hypothetical protein
MIMPKKSLYDKGMYKQNVDCFALGVRAWELATGTNAFNNVAQDSNTTAADLYYVIIERWLS